MAITSDRLCEWCQRIIDRRELFSSKGTRARPASSGRSIRMLDERTCSDLTLTASHPTVPGDARKETPLPEQRQVAGRSIGRPTFKLEATGARELRRFRAGMKGSRSTGATTVHGSGRGLSNRGPADRQGSQLETDVGELTGSSVRTQPVTQSVHPWLCMTSTSTIKPQLIVGRPGGDRTGWPPPSNSAPVFRHCGDGISHCRRGGETWRWLGCQAGSLLAAVAALLEMDGAMARLVQDGAVVPVPGRRRESQA